MASFCSSRWRTIYCLMSLSVANLTWAMKRSLIIRTQPIHYCKHKQVSNAHNSHPHTRFIFYYQYTHTTHILTSVCDTQNLRLNFIYVHTHCMYYPSTLTDSRLRVWPPWEVAWGAPPQRTGALQRSGPCNPPERQSTRVLAPIVEGLSCYQGNTHTHTHTHENTGCVLTYWLSVLNLLEGSTCSDYIGQN